MFADTATSFSNARMSGRTYHRHRLRRKDPPCTKDSDLFVICASKTQKQRRTFLYSHPFTTSKEILQLLGNFYRSAFHTWIFQAMRTGSALVHSRPSISAGQHVFLVTNVGNSPGDAVKVPIEDGVAEKRIAVCNFNLHACRRKEDRLKIFQVNEYQNPLGTVVQKHDDDLLRSLRESEP